jgi:two-component system sensor histidine kinase KdpD
MQQSINQIAQLEVKRRIHWPSLALDTLLAVGGPLLLTLIIFVQHLYPTIPNISILYLLVILPLASLRGRYSALLAALVAFLSFDFFLIPPFFTLNIAHTEEWIALGIFLVTALLTSQLAAVMRQRADEAWRREREARILYDVMHIANQKVDLADQLDIIALALVRVFAPWGVRECALLLPDAHGHLQVEADAPIQIERFVLSDEERAAVTVVMSDAQAKVYASALSSTGVPAQLHLLPLKAGTQVLGVLALRTQNVVSWFPDTEPMEEGTRGNTRVEFFWTFLDQAITIIERGRLRARV